MKKALLVTSFGSTYDHALRHSIEALEDHLRARFPEHDVFRAFTSGRIIRALQKRGITVDSVETALDRLANAGYRDVFLQPSHILNGFEYDKICAAAEKYRDSFRTLTIGWPLFHSTSDIETVCRLLENRFHEENTALILMGHGTDHEANRLYSNFLDAAERLGYHDLSIATVEASPSLDDILPALKAGAYEKIILTPLLFVAGDHANRDMAGEEPESLKSRLEAEGFQVAAVIKGLGEYEEIRALYAEHAGRFLASADSRETDRVTE